MKMKNEEWRAFQERVAALFRTIPNCIVSVGERLHGARIGMVETDVVARFRGQSTGKLSRRPHHFEFAVIIECKFWRKKIPQEKIFALKTIVEDVGAAMGILVSEVGMQSGVLEYSRVPNNIRAMTFTELKAFAAGDYVGNCTLCGTQAVIPFEPYPDPRIRVYCRDCIRLKYGR
jgi:CxxC-x17-CxxC domain-containing protein